MSHDEPTGNINSNNPPAWAQEMLFRLTQLELQNSSNSRSESNDIVAEDIDHDNYVVERPPAKDLILYQELSSAIPSITNDFFRSPITDMERRRFLGTCPRNEGMVYDPPILNEIGLSADFKKGDNRLYDIQYKLSGLTRPIDYFVHSTIQDPRALTPDTAIEFANLMRMLLSDLATHVTQMRMDDAYKASKIPGKAPQVLHSNSKPLFEPKELVEHVTSMQAMQKSVSKNQNKNITEVINKNTTMSHDEPTGNINSNNPPAWAQEMLFRLTQLELQNSSNSRSESNDIVAKDIDHDNYVVERPPAKDLILYQELSSAIPSITNDFFRSPITDMERRRFLGTCPRNIGMVYDPPILNEIGLSADFKKGDNRLYDIQYKLSGLTRPIDYFVHSTIQDPRALTPDTAIEFANLMQMLLSDLATHVTQMQMDDAYKASKTPGKAPQVLHSNSKPLFEPKELVKHVTLMQAMQKSVVHTRDLNTRDYNRRRYTITYNTLDKYSQPVGAHNSNTTYQPRQENTSKSQPSNFNSSTHGRPFVQRGRGKNSISRGETESLPKSPPTTIKMLYKSRPKWLTIKNSVAIKKEIMVLLVKQAIEEVLSKAPVFFSQMFTIPKKSGELRPFKNSLQDDLPKGLDDQYRLIGQISACADCQFITEVPEVQLDEPLLTIQSTIVWTISKPTGIYQNTTTSAQVGKTTGGQNQCLLRRLNNLRIFDRRVNKKYNTDSETFKKTGVFDSAREVYTNSNSKIPKKQNKRPPEGGKLYTEKKSDNNQKFGFIYWQNAGNGNNFTPGTTDDQENTGAKKYSSIKNPQLDHNCENHQTSNRKSKMVERQPTKLEWSMLSSRKSRGSGVYRRQQLTLKDCNKQQTIFRELDPSSTEAANKCQKANGNNVCLKNTSNQGDMCYGLLGQQYVNSIR
ncbi:hypothetical protein BB561_004615 [Smittium simulii]|uniref:Uncharacterized protein n=1 Tax=Smittium simulii TaxID=133385 RepID=A0A2T9YFB2_9FUNG|nr:hypothetical protein BB561_004615 [Smittium simulii]